MKSTSQRLHEAEIESVRKQLTVDYPIRLRKMTAEFKCSGTLRMWLLYHAHYLVSTAGVRWAVDPYLPEQIIPEPLAVSGVPEALRSLSFLLLTHAHSDHLDIPLLKFLCGSSVRFIVPDHMLDLFNERVGPPQDQITVARYEEPLEIDSIRISPFCGLHRAVEADGVLRGCDCTGYMVEAGGKRLLFPGDVRRYRTPAVAHWAPADVFFGHLWLGRSGAYADEPPLLDEFCEFAAASRPRKVVISHLYSFQHPTSDTWTFRHARLAREELRKRLPGVKVLAPKAGEEIEL